MNPIESLESAIRSGNTIEIPAFLTSWLSKQKLNFIEGEWREGIRSFDTINPATEEKLAEISEAGPKEVARATQAARRVFEAGAFSRRKLGERAAFVRRLGDLILEHRAPLAILETLDTGKPIRESFDGDIVRAASNFHFFADFVTEKDLSRDFVSSEDLHRAIREPLGVVALITPWNLPLYLETWKLAPSLLMGNSVILKPSELTPLTATYLAELIQELDLPKGVFQLLHGFGEKSVGEFLVSDPLVSAISFTGETRTGQAIMRNAAPALTRVSFELGGKGASIVFSDAPTSVYEESIRSSFRNQGEICLALPRIYVERSFYPKFVREFVERTSKIRVGDPLNWNTDMGALIGPEHYKKVKSYLGQAIPPLEIRCGGGQPEHCKRGYFLEPTVLTRVPQEHSISQEEIFGPVVSIYPFDTEEEVIGFCNGTRYGLSASVWTEQTERAMRVASSIRSGLVWINCWFRRDLRVPFGGQKMSGLGREGGLHSIDFFSDWKSIGIAGGARGNLSTHSA